MSKSVSRGSIKVAVVDDDPGVRDSLLELFASLGWEAVGYKMGHEFLQQMHQERPDCLVLDLRMPDMSGLDMLAELKARGLVLPVILLSGGARPQESRKAEALGAAAVLQKPVDSQLLVQHIERVLRPGSS